VSTRVVQSIETASALVMEDGDMARSLQVKAGASALKVVRRYFDAQGEVFEVSVSVHPADRFSISMRLRR
jgi:DNA-binding GntR family transcriptional regulator